MAEDPRIFLHFKTLAKFNEKLADGTINPDKHLVFIKGTDTKPEGIIWCRGVFYADNFKLSNFISYYNDWEVTQSDANTLKIKLKGNKWNNTTRAWEAISKELTLNSATQSIAGLMSAYDKHKVGRITGTNHQLSNPTTTGTQRVLKLEGINPNDGTTVKTEVTLPSATQADSGLLSNVDKKAIDNLASESWSHISDESTFTADANDVKINFSCRSTTMESTAASTSHSNPIGAASSTRAGVMTSTDKIELDRISTANFNVSSVTTTASDVKVNADKTNITTNASVDNSFTLPASTADKAGVMTAANYVQVYTTLPNNITTEKNRAVAQEDKIEAAVGLNTDGTHKTTTGNYTKTATTITGEIAALDTQAKANADAIAAETTNRINAINALDVSDTAVSGQYVNKVSETDGKISVTRTDVSGAPLNNYTKGTDSTAVAAADTINAAISKLENQVDAANTARDNAIKALDKADTAVTNQFVTAVSETDGIITVSRARPTAGNVSNTAITASNTQVGLAGTDVQTTIGNIATAIKTEETARTSADSTLTTNLTNEITRAKGAEKANADAIAKEITDRATAITNAINGLDATVTSTDGTNVQVKVTEADGKITAVNVTTDNTINSTDLTNAINGLDADKSGTSTSGHVKVQVVETDGKVSSVTVTDSDIASAATLSSHTGNTSNPHSVTKSQVGLGNVTNESKATMFTSPTFTGTPVAPTAAATTNTTQIATTAFVQSAIESKLAANDAMIYKGTVTSNAGLPTKDYSAGWTYKVATAGTYVGVTCEVGDMIIATTDATAGQSAINNTHWSVIQTNVDGAVTGPTSATNGAVALFNGTTGKIIQNSSTVGSASQPIYLNNGVPTAGSYSFGNGSGNVPVSNGTVNVNFNADMLDGLDASAFARADGSAAQDINNLNGKGIMCNPQNANVPAS